MIWKVTVMPNGIFECPVHGDVDPTERQHGGRSHAFVCPEEPCGHTVRRSDVDWDAYRAAKDAGEKPPCPECGSGEITEVPITGAKYRCQPCGHAYGDGGAYR